MVRGTRTNKGGRLGIDKHLIGFLGGMTYKRYHVPKSLNVDGRLYGGLIAMLNKDVGKAPHPWGVGLGTTSRL